MSRHRPLRPDLIDPHVRVEQHQHRVNVGNGALQMTNLRLLLLQFSREFCTLTHQTV